MYKVLVTTNTKTLVPSAVHVLVLEFNSAAEAIIAGAIINSTPVRTGIEQQAQR